MNYDERKIQCILIESRSTRKMKNLIYRNFSLMTTIKKEKRKSNQQQNGHNTIIVNL